MIDGFEGGVVSSLWSAVVGGGIGLGCGALLPFAHGKTLYFNGCGLREAVTTEMDTTKARYGIISIVNTCICCTGAIH